MQENVRPSRPSPRPRELTPLKHGVLDEDLGDDEDDDILPTDEVSSVPWLQPDDLEQLGSNGILSAHHRQQIYDSNVAKWCKLRHIYT